MGDEAYDEMVQRFLRDLVDEVVQYWYRRSDIRAIVLVRGAIPTAFAKLGEIALEAVGTDAVRIDRGIEPAEVMACGAASFARKL
jgi:hypothetical protein